MRNSQLIAHERGDCGLPVAHGLQIVLGHRTGGDQDLVGLSQRLFLGGGPGADLDPVGSEHIGLHRGGSTTGPGRGSRRRRLLTSAGILLRTVLDQFDHVVVLRSVHEVVH